jgi:hypothetical protein
VHLNVMNYIESLRSMEAELSQLRHVTIEYRRQDCEIE